MNAIVNDTRAAHAAPHPTRKFGWLLRRELWEHKGGFVWAPLVASAIFLLFTLLGGGTGHYMLQRHGAGKVMFNGRETKFSQVDWDQLLGGASPADLQQLHDAVNGSLLMAAFWPLTVLGFVVFFYFLGALFDERKDRSVLFWKSLPVSDAQTVLSKLTMGLVVAPLIAIAVAAVTIVLFAVLAMIFLGINGVPVGRFVSMIDPITLAGALVSWVPMYALWALPTAGWLLLCSAWARSKPFLWAIGVPVFAGMLVSWFGLLNNFAVEGSKWFWENIVVRSLAGVFPGTHAIGMAQHLGARDINGINNLSEFALAASGYSLLTSPALWIGALAGVAMIIAAIRLRRWRDDA